MGGAAGALAHALRAVTKPGDTVITFAPYFPEYIPYVTGTGAELKVVPADPTSFQINFEKLEEYLTPDVAAVLINSPNNPSGIVYTTETIKRLAALLEDRQKEYGHEIFLITDEPYREIIFEGTDSPFISKLYDNSICCYSFSKSLSLPGERIGYLAVNPAAKDAELIVPMCGQISRFTGHNCPSSLMQRAIEGELDNTSDLSIYEKNAVILMGGSLDKEIPVSNLAKEYNFNFDNRALTATCMYLFDNKKWLNREVKFACIWAGACDSIMNTQKYVKWANKNGYISEKGNPMTSAEVCFRYITGDTTFQEDHMGKSDAEIEAHILTAILRRKKKVDFTPCGNPWKKVAKIYNEVFES